MKYLVGLLLVLTSSELRAEDLPLIYETNFEQGASEWSPKEPKGWKVKKTEKGNVYSQFEKEATYKPPHRSPFHISLLNDQVATSFVFDAKVLSTHPDYGHRDACMVFGYQDPAHFYYVHFGKQGDNHANQIFIVNGADRKKISLTTTTGTPWNDEWHEVRVKRDVESGSIEVFFDDMEKPAMTANDKTFLWGSFGVGTFDDTSDWDDIMIRGMRK